MNTDQLSQDKTPNEDEQITIALAFFAGIIIYCLGYYLIHQ
jgi:hypothetical protein